MNTLKTLIGFWLLSLPLLLCSQINNRLIVLDFIQAEEGQNRTLNMFLTTEDVVLSSSICYEGQVSFLLESQMDNNVFIAFRLRNNSVYRIALKGLLARKTIELPQFTLHLVADKYLSDTEAEDYRKHIIDSNDDPPTKLWLDFSTEGQMRLNDTVRWFFPTKTLMNVDAQEGKIKNSCYIENFYNEFGRYPSESELDNLAENMSIGTAEDLIGWYSWHLLRLNEKELYNETTRNVYRFTMVSNKYFYTYEPYSMRIEICKDGGAVLYFAYEIWDECDQHDLYCDIVPLDEDCFVKFIKLFQQLGFWEASYTENPNKLYETEVTYIIEALVNGQYHVMFRGAGEDEALDGLQEFLWELTGLGKNKIIHFRQRIE